MTIRLYNHGVTFWDGFASVGSGDSMYLADKNTQFNILGAILKLRPCSYRIMCPLMGRIY